MATKISTDEYQAFMKTLQARRGSVKPKTERKQEAPKTETITGNEDSDPQVHPLHKQEALLLEETISDSGSSNDSPSGTSTPTAMSSGVSLERAGRNERQESSDQQHTSDGQQEERGSEERHIGSRDSEPTARESLYIVTPSKLLAKIENREAAMEASGVGSFHSFTSPSILMRTEVRDMAEGKMEDDEHHGGTPSVKSLPLPMKQVMATAQGRQGASISMEPLSFEEQKMRELRSQLEYGTLSSEEDSPPRYGHPGRRFDEQLTPQTVIVDSSKHDDDQLSGMSFFDYSTPSNLLLRREQRASAEAAAGVGSFESFTTPSELFVRKPHVGFVSMEEKTTGPSENQSMKSSTEQFSLGDSPSELLRLKTEMMVSQRIGSRKSLNKSLLQDMAKKESLRSSTPMQPAETALNRNDMVVSSASDGADVFGGIQSGQPETNQHVVFVEKTGKPEDKVDAVLASSGSDISLIEEEPNVIDEEEDVSSESSGKGDVKDLWRDSPEGDRMIHSHKLVYKAKSFPLMHVKREMLCCGNDPIACECSSQESVEKLVGLDVFVNGEEEERDVGHLADPLDDSHSWADATLRSLQLVLEGAGEDTQMHLKGPEDVADEWKEFSTQTEEENLREEPEDVADEWKEFSTQTEEEDLREVKDTWSLMEDKLDYTRKLLHHQKKAEEEKAHMVQLHHRMVNELVEQNQEAKLTLQQQEEQIHMVEDLQATNRMLERDLAATVEEYTNLELAHHLKLEGMDIMEEKIKSLTFDLESYARECSRLGESFSLREPSLERSQNSSPMTTGTSYKHAHPKTAHAKIFIELDEDQNKFTIDTQVDRSFLCGDGTKTDGELQAATESLTEYIKNELLHNLLPLLYHHSPHGPVTVVNNKQTPGFESPKQMMPHTTTGPADPGASVTVTLGEEGDTKVRIHAEMDAGFLCHDRNQTEVNFITRKVVEYVRDHFLERILQKLFPDEDIGSKFSISSDVRSSSLHAVIPVGERGLIAVEVDTPGSDLEMPLAEPKTGHVAEETLEQGCRLGEAVAEVNALRGIVQKQELEKGTLLEKLERRSAQLKDICGQFSESEKQWIDEKAILVGHVKDVEEVTREAEREREAHGQQIQGLESHLSRLNKDLEVARKELRDTRQQQDETEKKSQDLVIGIMRLKDENVALTEQLRGVNAGVGDLRGGTDSGRRVQEGRRPQEAARELQEETGLSIEGMKAMEQVIVDLKNENHHLQTYLEALSAPSQLSMPQTSHFVPLHQNAHLRHPTDVVTIPSDRYHTLIEDNGRLTSRVTGLEQEKVEHHLLLVEHRRLLSEVNRLRDEGSRNHILVEANQMSAVDVSRLEKGKEELNVVVLENQQLKSRISQLENEKEDHLARGRVLYQELQRFQTETGDLKGCITQLTGDLKEALLQSRNLEHRLETDELKAGYRHETRMRDAEDSKREKEIAMLDKMSVLEARNRQLEGDMAGRNDEFKKLQEKKSSLEENLSETNQKLIHCQDDLRRVTEQFNAKQAQLITASSLLEELKYEKGGLSTKLLDLHHTLLKAQSEAEKTKGHREGEFRKLQSKITLLEKDLCSARSSLDQARNSLQTTTSDLESAQAACEVKAQLVRSLGQEKEAMMMEMRGLDGKLKERGMRALMMTDAHLHRQEEIGKLNSTLAEQTSELREIRNELARKTGELYHQTEAGNNLKSNLERLSQEKVIGTEAKERLEGEILKQNEELARLQEMCEHLQNEGERLCEELKIAHKEREDSSSSLLQLQQQYQALYENHTRLDCKTETDRSFTSFLQEELGRTRETVDQLKDQARDLKTELERSERNVEEKEDELERSISESQGEVAKLQTSLEETSTSYHALQQSNEDQARRLTEEEQKVTTLTDELEQLQKEFLQERNAFKKMSEGKERLREQLDERIEKLYNEKNSLQDALYQAELSAKVDQCKRDSLAKELNHLKKCFERQMSESATTAENLTDLEKQMEELQEDNTELHDTVTSLEEHCQELIKEVAQKRKEITGLTEQLATSLGENRGYQSKIGDLEGLIQRERALTESAKKVSKEKKKKWQLRNQLFSSKVKTQLELSEERTTHLEAELMRVNHENHLQGCEVTERSQVIQRLMEGNASLEESQSALLEELGRVKRQLSKERELVQSLSESLMKSNDTKCNRLQSLSPQERSSYNEISTLGGDKSNMQEEMKSLEAEMKRNLKDEIQDHVKLITKQFIAPKKRELIEDIAAEISEMREQRHQDTKKIENISANLGALSSTLEERLQTPPPAQQGTRKRRLSTVSEMNEAIRKANVRSSGRAGMAFHPRIDSNRLTESEASPVFNNSSILAGSADLFYIPELSSSTNKI